MTTGEPPIRDRAAIGPALLQVLEVANRPHLDHPPGRYGLGSTGPSLNLVHERHLRFDGIGLSSEDLDCADPRTAEHFDSDGRLPVYLVPWISGTSSTTSAIERLAEHLAESVDGQVMAHPLAGAVTVQVDPAQLAALMDVPDVAAIELSPETDVGLLATSVPQVMQSGRRSCGSAVGVLDGGIDSSHPALEVADVRNTSAEPLQASIHGTHVAGCLGSND